MDRAYRKTGGDFAIVLMFFLLACLGLVNLYSASSSYATTMGKSPGFFVGRQLFWYIPALAVFAVSSILPLDLFRRFSSLAVLASLCLLVLPFVPGIGINRNGASRWFGFGQLMFQPSELFKPVIVIYLSAILSKKADRLGDIVNTVLPPLIVAVIGVVLVVLQNDFSTALLIAILALVSFWIARVPLIFFLASGSLAAPLLALTVLTSDYRLRRVLGFIAPGFDPSDISYQVNASARAIRAGGLWGKGLGQGTLKMGSIPEVQSDFVFASWVEETGLLGVLIFSGLWVFLISRCWQAAMKSRDLFMSHLCFAMSTYLALQVLVNIMVVVGAIPATGIPLPLFSAGGSSLLSVAIAAGILVNVTKKIREEEVQNA